MHDNLLQAPNYKPRLSAGEHTKMCADKHQIVSIDINAQQEQLLTIARRPMHVEQDELFITVTVYAKPWSRY